MDGQQRLNAIFDFFNDDLRLSKESAAEFGGDYYSELDSKYSDAFDDFEIQTDVITDAKDDEIKRFFLRLQQGLPLTGSEQLNAVPSNLRDFARKLANHNFFRSKVSVPDTRYAHFDVASKVAAIEVDGLDAGTRFEELKATFESQASFSESSQVALRLKSTFDFLDQVFPSRADVLRNRTVVQSFATLVLDSEAEPSSRDMMPA